MLFKMRQLRQVSLLRNAAFSLFPVKNYAFLLMLGWFLPPSVLEAQIQGKVYRDFNADGNFDSTATYKEVGLSGITVTAYNAAGTSVGTTTTNATGNYTITSVSGAVRVEFTGGQTTDFATAKGTGNGTSVQFVTAPSTGINLGLNYSKDYCSTTNPTLVTNCYVSGDQVNGVSKDDPVLISFPYNAGSRNIEVNSFTTYDNPNTHDLGVAAKFVGTTFGLAFARNTQRLYVSSFFKKHTGFGPGADGVINNADDAGAIYVLNASSGAVVSAFTVPNATTNAHNTSDYLRDNDNVAWDAVGKTSLGGLDISDDEKTLYTLNLQNRRLYALNAATGAVVTSASTSGLLPTGCALCNQTSDVRPFAVEYYKGKVYIGLIYSAESSGDSSHLRAYIYTADPTTLAFSASPVLEFPLNYPRGKAASTGPADWRAWTPTYTNISTNLGARIVYPMPLFTSITFDNGSLIIGLRDRVGDIAGNQSKDNPNTADAAYENLYQARTAGDLLRAAGSPSTGWTLESAGRSNGTGTATQNTGQGMGNAEFYHGDAYPASSSETGNINYTVNGVSYTITTGMTTVTNGAIGNTQGFGANHDEISLGTAIQISGMPDVVAVVMDPTLDNGSEGFHDGGIRWLNNTTGAWAQSYRIYNGDGVSSVNLGKANGLGELVTLCGAQPLEIGNRVWRDTDKDGIQDAGETGISGLTVELYRGTTRFGTTTTDANGNYYFNNANVNLGGVSGLKPDSTYQIRIGTAQGPLSNLSLTTANVGSNGSDLIDNDATTAGSNAIIDVTLGNAGENNHTLDFGFKQPEPCTIDITTVSVSDCYQLAGASKAAVQVRVAWTNIPIGDSIKVTVGGVDKFIYVTAAGSPQMVQFVVNADGSTSNTITASAALTPACSDNDTYNAPAACPPTPCLASDLGGKAWVDISLNGKTDSLETQGLAGIEVKIYDCAGNLVGTETTDRYGNWKKSGLTFGGATDKYRVEFANLPPQYIGTLKGQNSNTTVQFVSASSCNVDLGVSNPVTYCNSDPNIVLSCFAVGDPTQAGTTKSIDAIVTFPYKNSVNHTPAPTHEVYADPVGAVWGLTYQRDAQLLFSAAFVKRHSGLGALGTGGIYVTDFKNPSRYTEPLIDLSSLTGVIGTRDLTGDHTLPTRDTNAFNLNGKRGLGDMDMSEDGKTIWVTNLNANTLVKIDISKYLKDTNDLPTLADVTSYPIPSVTGCPTGDSRVMGLGVKDGKVFVTNTCTGESTQNHDDLKAVVYSFDGSTFTSVADVKLNYRRGFLNHASGESPFCEVWQPWTRWSSDFLKYENVANTDWPCYAQPVASDIVFDNDGTMILAIMDRSGHQMAYANYSPIDGDLRLYNAVTGGDVLRLTPQSSGQYMVESGGISGTKTGSGLNNKQGIGGGEFYGNDGWTTPVPHEHHQESAFGALVFVPGNNEVGVTRMDPLNNTWEYGTGGLAWYSNENGGDYRGNGYNVYPLGGFGKGNGLGSLEAMCAPAPKQIGNFVWIDTDKDGIQDPCEPPLSNLNISLYKMGTNSTTLVATTTTDANGNYYFTDSYETGGFDTLMTDAMYFVVAGESGQFNTTNQKLTIGGTQYELGKQNNGAGTNADLNDTDAFISNDATKPFNGYPVDTLTVGGAGSINHSLDFGFQIPCAPVTITNVAFDTAKCVNGVMGSDAWVAVRGIAGMAKYAYRTNATDSLWNNTATASTADSIRISNIANPASATTYTFRIWGTDTTCFNDTTVILTPSVCPPCSITGTFTQNTCNNNGTTATGADDHFTVTVSAVSATNGGTSGKYEVVLMPAGTVLNAGGTNYGTPITVGGAGVFSANGTTTYMLKVRDLDKSTCESSVFTSTATAACSIIPCPPLICVPVTVTRN
jgi:SdrD B-like domain